MVFRQKPLQKANFIVKMTGLAGQFWQMESAVSLRSRPCPCECLTHAACHLSQFYPKKGLVQGKQLEKISCRSSYQTVFLLKR